ncbi:glycerophosphodiester phosphodiesterase [Methylocaldum sp.]|uniref:glycerophosphodiester phosphodiesterase n=1 Tax=Methylocaldum sp. TaxID=1969727 RepID=UPI002D4C8D65|nr:glycerophosphodiester phosphodiesterase [Methylocaldum sp.]HYE37958.1 glycerophosphodiester phosphodiesterase [Methylocaldum sp.]
MAGCTRYFKFPTLSGEPPVVIAHRGASGYMPEHTLSAYKLAIEQGADFIEPDLVSTNDGVLIARHELNITETTNVAEHPEFADRRTTKVIDGVSVEGWFADDFTLAEIKTLRAKQRLPFRSQQFDDLCEIPTLEEVIELVKQESERSGRVIGIYPETKHPTYHRSAGLPLEKNLVKLLERHKLNHRTAPVMIQSFEAASLKALRRMTEARLVQLIDGNGIAPDGGVIPGKPYDFTVSGDPRTYADLLTREGLAEIKTYADGIGPWKRYLVGVTGTGGVDALANDSHKKLGHPTHMVREAHNAGLFVHAWTFRNEPRYLASDYGSDPLKEYWQFYRLGVDGVFSDFPDTAIAARAALEKRDQVPR